MMRGDLLIRNAQIAGRAVCDVRVRRGVIVEMAARLIGGEEAIDARGGALIAGLHDHHIHLMASAAAALSVDVSPAHVADARAFAAALRAADRASPKGAWLRGVNYHESVAGPLSRGMLDGIALSRPVRIQYATGSLWALNSEGLHQVLPLSDWPECVERGDDGLATGRIWRGDAWLRSRLRQSAPDLAPLSARLARSGVTGVCDASVTTDDAAAAQIALSIREGALRQRVMLMSGGRLARDKSFHIGPVKILLDDADLPQIDDVIARIRAAHAWGRNCAVHCVTRAEIALTLAAFEAVGAQAGDRIEHGGVICAQSTREIARLGLRVITQPGFIAERGDRYLRETPPDDHDALYPCGSLLRAGIKVAGSTDAPYTAGDVWSAMRAATQRRTSSGRLIGSDERIEAARALALFQGSLRNPGGPPRRVRVGARADLCVLDRPLAAALEALSADCVAATIVAGRCIYAREPAAVETSYAGEG